MTKHKARVRAFTRDVAYTYRMPVGIPGAVNRVESADVEPNQIDSAAPPTVYGGVVKVVAGLIRGIASGDAATVIYGMLVRPYPTNAANAPLGTQVPPPSGPCDVLRRGRIFAKLAFGTASKGAQLYVRVTAGSGRIVGDLEMAADSGNCVAIAGAFTNGPADSNGIVEVMYNI